jgi:hypothetical protein
MIAFIILYEARVIPPPQMIANSFMIEIKQVIGYARDVEVCMCSTMSTCPQVVAICYPPI